MYPRNGTDVAARYKREILMHLDKNDGVHLSETLIGTLPGGFVWQTKSNDRK